MRIYWLSLYVVATSLMLLATSDRLQDWATERRLWATAAAAAPAKPRPHINLGNQALRDGDTAAAIHSYEHARAIAAYRPSDERTLGRALATANLLVMQWNSGARVDAMNGIMALERQYPTMDAVVMLRQRWDREWSGP